MDLQVLDHRPEPVFRIIEADAPVHAAGVREGIVEHEPEDGGNPLGVFMVPAPPGRDPEGFPAVIIVSVDGDERLVDDIPRHQDRMAGAPGLFPAFRNAESLRDHVQFLADEPEFHFLSVRTGQTGVFGEDSAFHFLAEGFPDDVDYLSESGFDGVVDGIIDDGFPGGAHPVHLFQSSVAASLSSREYKQCRFHLFLRLLKVRSCRTCPLIRL